MVLAEKKIPHEVIECDLQNKSKELLDLNPYGKVPVLVDGDHVVYESAIINEYLEEKYPEVPLMPKDLGLRANARIWIDFCNTRLQAAAGDIRHKHEPEKAKKRLQQHLEVLDREMADREYLVGSYSLADITYIPFFLRLDRYETSIDSSLANLKAWMDRLLARPTVQSTP